MKIYLISQKENDGYDTYDSAVVAARSEDEARKIHPHEDMGMKPYNWDTEPTGGYLYGWCASRDKVTVKLLGTAVVGTKAGLIMASFNAG